MAESVEKYRILYIFYLSADVLLTDDPAAVESLFKLFFVTLPLFFSNFYLIELVREIFCFSSFCSYFYIRIFCFFDL